MLPLRDNVPTRSFPFVTVGLIAANVVVFLWEQARLDVRVVQYGYHPCDLASSCVGG